MMMRTTPFRRPARRRQNGYGTPRWQFGIGIIITAAAVWATLQHIELICAGILALAAL